MIIIKKQSGDNFDKMLKNYKYKSIRLKLNKQIRENKEFTKPSVKKRKEKLKAIYRQSLNSSN